MTTNQKTTNRIQAAWACLMGRPVAYRLDINKDDYVLFWEPGRVYHENNIHAGPGEPEWRNLTDAAKAWAK